MAGIVVDQLSHHPSSGGIRFHRASNEEQYDGIQVFGGLRQLRAAVSITSVWHCKRKGAVLASVPTAAAFGGAHAPASASSNPGPTTSSPTKPTPSAP